MSTAASYQATPIPTMMSESRPQSAAIPGPNPLRPILWTARLFWMVVRTFYEVIDRSFHPPLDPQEESF